jgi:hypothetical protein
LQKVRILHHKVSYICKKESITSQLSHNLVENLFFEIRQGWTIMMLTPTFSATTITFAGSLSMCGHQYGYCFKLMLNKGFLLSCDQCHVYWRHRLPQNVFVGPAARYYAILAKKN